ncbi:hypothetical protein GGH94_001068 [Coemansia aciculifera]|uniref:Uncharacterized protein n=1 Tax=Coemansia aciculifera TaxID=417176 RepID=A0A9W8INF8_9FUNG|nr:hypothetical protein GGH94_001068 [Coemansia aciculifera]KAJ2874364.1 hypothetical protein GGH93_002492 [Coemansia aciculifera]
MSHQSQNIPVPSPGDKQILPIPISMTGGLRSGAYTGSEAGTSRHLEAKPRFPPGSPGTEAPPNSLATQPLHLNQGSLGEGKFAGGGWNAPPNTPAQPNKLQQMMASAGVGSGSMQGYSTSNVPTHSFVEKKMCDMGKVREADEDEQMDQDMEAECSPDSSNHSSFRQDNRHMPNDGSENMFMMD